MAVSPDVARARFAAFVSRALREARGRGMNDAAIAKVTTVHPSTFHKWRSGEGGLPKWEKVAAFCRGLEIPAAAAYAALGIDEQRQAAPEAPLDPDLARLARILADPAVPEAEKQAIRHTVRMLARAVRTAPDREPVE